MPRKMMRKGVINIKGLPMRWHRDGLWGMLVLKSASVSLQMCHCKYLVRVEKDLEDCPASSPPPLNGGSEPGN